MARKNNVVKLGKVYDVSISPIQYESKFRLTIRGYNSVDNQVELVAEMEEWILPYITKEIKKLLDYRLEDLKQLVEDTNKKLTTNG